MPPTDLADAAPRALADVAHRLGLKDSGAQLIRLFASAVYHLPAEDAIARITPSTSPEVITHLATSVRVTRWLAEAEFPAVEPLAVPQPATSHGCALTFWRYLPQHRPTPTPADLGDLLRRLHQLTPPPFSLPSYQPLRSTRQAIQHSQAISEEERTWLAHHCQQLLDAYQHLTFALPPGMIHGDAWQGNLLRNGSRVVLADWDAVSTGPREIDLIPTLQATRFGLPPDQREAFITAYGHDIRTWPGYPVLRDIRELSTLTALLRNAHLDPAARDQLYVRLHSLRTGDTRPWTSF